MKNNKERTAVWLYPETIERLDGWLNQDNCKSRSEFIEKALCFYMGYLGTEDTSSFFPRPCFPAWRERCRKPKTGWQVICFAFRWKSA